MTDSSAHCAPQPSNLPSLYAETIAMLREGTRPPVVIRDMARRGVAPALITDVLQRALQHLELERAGDHADEVVREIAARVAADHDPAAIVRGVGARGITATTAQRLTEAALVAQQRRRVGVRRGRVAAATATMLLFALLTYAILSPEPNAILMAQSQQQTVEANVVRVPNAVVIARHLKVRSGPHVDDPLLTELMANDRLVVISRAEELGRYYVMLSDAREGWVRGDPNLLRIDVPIDTIPLASFGQ